MAKMLSDQGKKSLDLIFTRAAKTNLVRDPNHQIKIEILPEARQMEALEENLVVLTISSYTFRLIVMFHVNSSGGAATYYSRGTEFASLIEVFGEMVNQCCGGMNRDLGKHFPHMGMSTPSLLNKRCLPFLRELNPTDVSRYRISINDSFSMHVSLCFCAFAPIDFRIDEHAAEEALGELELF
ncbi:hypothetical protein [Propionivibrio dicarboxylicus]|uniref:Flagellar motor switch protein FliM n=1 Tax=Propionivibrio dicarboxylicus TaxID=83767 RepID=A0A1G8ERG0_9RHOO|nr:hypothetical protein [Propionivibrio dicarboxylicus]SDH72456.1 hypothetical protein SAMN05660652_02168 [Propionivibrio dicarboxylicus]